MMLERTGAHTVEDRSAGFVIREAFPHWLDYEEGRTVVRFAAEMTGPASPYAIILYFGPESLRPRPSHAAEEPARQREIVTRVTAALALLRITPLWSGGPPDRAPALWGEYWRDVYAEALSRVAAQMPPWPPAATP